MCDTYYILYACLLAGSCDYVDGEVSLMTAGKQKERLKGLLIFMLALLAVYALLTLAMAVMFEYYMVSTSGGSIIFSLSMSWQIMLFAAELITIIVQIIFLVRTMKNKKTGNYRVILYAGIAAAAMASAVYIMLVVFQGFTVNPAAVFLMYALLITAVRAVLLPTAIKRYIYS